MTQDPFALFRRWYKQAQRIGVPQIDAMAVATADEQGRPSVRFVLLKQADTDGFVFYTRETSRKGRELGVNPRAAGVCHWDAIGRQVRFEGAVERLSYAEADAYWRTRPRESQLSAWASNQGAPLASRTALLARWKALRTRFRGRPIPRPSGWIGYRVVPDAIEFWTERPWRLHHRELFLRTRTGWKRRLLQP
ncbi:MAG: pyridoxamine 5'-phosphate oxidase [Candidatus Binatia bacterium]